jgi:polyisoprenyl-teichoic acid--peptidoglycan teichoic acid transferase
LRRDLPPYERPRRPRFDDYRAARRSVNLPVLIGIVAFAVIAAYSSLVVVTQADEILFPGNPFPLANRLGGLPGVDAGDKPDQVGIDDRINVVFLGLDLMRDDPPDMPARTDSVIVFTIDPYSKTAGALSIPRDTLVEIPDGYGSYTQNRINIAYEMGEGAFGSRYPGGGAQLVKDTIERNFGIPIDYYAVLNFNNFIELIDELGGVEVEIEHYAFDPAYHDCNTCPYYAIEFVPGVEHMDGTRALAFARIRASDNDFRRIERQQALIRATAKRASNIGVLLGSNPINLYRKFKDSIQTDISDFQIPGLAALGRQIDPDTIRTVSLAPATYDCVECPGAVLRFDPVQAEELIAEVFTDGRLQTEYAVIEVLNGTVVPDLAGDFAAHMRQQGVSSQRIKVDEYADGELYSDTLIIDITGNNPYTVGRLAAWLNLPNSRIIEGTEAEASRFLDTFADVVVVLGADAEVPAAVTRQTGGF